MECPITATEFKSYFDRGDFSYGITLPDVRDSDIEKAIVEAEAIFNEGLYPSTKICEMAKMYLAAHFLRLDLDRSDSGGQVKGIQNSRSVGSISESITVPEWMTQGVYAMYATTDYGVKYLMITKQYIDGAVYSVPGGTNF